MNCYTFLYTMRSSFFSFSNDLRMYLYTNTVYASCSSTSCFKSSSIYFSRQANFKNSLSVIHEPSAFMLLTKKLESVSLGPTTVSSLLPTVTPQSIKVLSSSFSSDVPSNNFS